MTMFLENEDITMNNPTTRRNLLIAASLGGAAVAASIAPYARGQTARGPSETRELHAQQWLDRIVSTRLLVDTPSPTNMNGDIERLIGLNVLEGRRDSTALHNLVSMLFDEYEDLQSFVDDVEQTIEQTTSSLGEMAETIIAVVPRSVDAAADVLRELDGQRALTVIAYGVQGALRGARFGLLGASIGGVSGLIIGYDRAGPHSSDE